VGGVFAERLQLGLAVYVVAAAGDEDAVGEFEAEVVLAAGEPVEQGRREQLRLPVLVAAGEDEGAGVLQLLGAAEVDAPHLGAAGGADEVAGAAREAEIGNEADADRDPGHDQGQAPGLGVRVVVGIGDRVGVGVVGEGALDPARKAPAGGPLDLAGVAGQGRSLGRQIGVRRVGEAVGLGETCERVGSAGDGHRVILITEPVPSNGDCLQVGPQLPLKPRS
jgi:hypothetical protein